MKKLAIVAAVFLLALLFGMEHVHDPSDRPTPVQKDPVTEAKERIKLLCTHNYVISYYTNTIESRFIGENLNLVWALFERGDLECDFRDQCLYSVEVSEEGIPTFRCMYRE